MKLDDKLLTAEETESAAVLDLEVDAEEDRFPEFEARRELEGTLELRPTEILVVDTDVEDDLKELSVGLEVFAEDSELMRLAPGLLIDLMEVVDDETMLPGPIEERDDEIEDDRGALPTSSAPLMPELSSCLPTEPFR